MGYENDVGSHRHLCTFGNRSFVYCSWFYLDTTRFHSSINFRCFFSLLEDLLGPLFSLFESIFGWIFSFFETGATYILQFLGFTGSVAGQSIFGLGKDFVSAISESTGISPFVLYILLAELIFQIIYVLLEEFDLDGSKNWNCILKKIYKVLDAPFGWLTDDIFPSGFFHDILTVMFIPFRLLIFLTTVLVGTIYCDYSNDPLCKSVDCVLPTS